MAANCRVKEVKSENLTHCLRNGIWKFIAIIIEFYKLKIRYGKFIFYKNDKYYFRNWILDTGYSRIR